jgi:hypothetical protein
MVREITFQFGLIEKRDHGLDIEDVLLPVAISVAAVEVILQRHADEVSDGVGELLG